MSATAPSPAVVSVLVGQQRPPTATHHDRSERIPADDERTIEEQRALLRQLALGFGVHRLYPGNTTADAFVSATDRIQHAVARALTAGGTSFELRSGRFLVDGIAVDEQATKRLAQACYERRVEYLVIDEVPGREELARWFDALSRDPHAIEEAGGMERLLAELDVRSIRSASGSPETSSGEELPDELLELADWVATVPVEPSAEEVESLVLRPGESAEELYARLRELSNRIDRDGKVNSSFFQRAAWLVEELPEEGQAAFGRLVIDNLEVDGFAERFAGHLNDVDLATLLVVVAEHGEETAPDLAERAIRVAERHATLHRLVETVERDRREAVAADPGPRVAARSGGQVAQLGAVARGDLALADGQRELVDGFPADAWSGRQLALTAMVDLMMAGPRQDHLTEILSNIIDHLRDAVRGGDATTVEELLRALERAQSVASPEVASALSRVRRKALNAEVVAGAAVDRSRAGAQLEPDVLAPFGSAAVGPLVAAVGSEVTESVIGRLCELLPEVGSSHRATLHDEVAHQRPEVVARLVPVLARDDRSLPLLSQLALRNEPTILASVVEALPGRSGEVAAPIAAKVARRASDAALQRRCLDVLAGFGPTGREHLLSLAGSSERPRLPWARRRAARRLAHRMGER